MAAATALPAVNVRSPQGSRILNLRRTSHRACCVGVTPTNPASGDKINLMLVLEARVNS